MIRSMPRSAGHKQMDATSASVIFSAEDHAISKAKS